MTVTCSAADAHHVPCGIIPYTLKIRSGCEGGGKGALVQEDKSATLATNNDRYLFQPVPNLLLDDQGGQQINVRTDDKCPTLRAEAHGNVPAVVEQGPVVFRKGTRPHSADEAQKWEAADVANTLNTFDQGESRANELVVEAKPVYCLQGNTIDRDAKQNGSGICEGAAHTLNAVDRHGVAYGAEPITVHGESVAGTLLSRDYKGPGRWDSLDKVVAIDRTFFNQGQNAKYDPQYYTDGTNPTLVARGPSAVAVRYIVRRLTPTECARLQGFADRWGDIDEKDSFTPEEFEFWHEVRNTHAAINGKKMQDYTVKQMLTWYNKLQTDSAEYKMWGNGIALPPALYCMQGIIDALEKEAEDDWML